MYVIMNSDLPEPVIPATNPWGPWNFSWRSRLNKPPYESTPIGVCREIVGLFSFQRVKEFKCSILPTLNISRNVIIDGRAKCLLPRSNSMLAMSWARFSMAAVLITSALNEMDLPLVSSRVNTLDLSPSTATTSFVSLGRSWSSFPENRILNPRLFLNFSSCPSASQFSVSFLLVDIIT